MCDLGSLCRGKCLDDLVRDGVVSDDVVPEDVVDDELAEPDCEDVVAPVVPDSPPEADGPSSAWATPLDSAMAA